MVEIHDRSVFYWKFNYKLKNENIDEMKNNNIRKIKFGDDYNFEIDNLPDGITHLFLPKNYDKNIDNLPNTITHIYLNDSYNKELNYLPSTVKFIQFNPSYDCKINNLNNNLRELKLPLYYGKKINNLPNLDLLDIGIEFYRRINLPKTIKKLYIGEYYDIIFSQDCYNLEYLYFNVLHLIRFDTLINYIVSNIDKINDKLNIIIRLPNNYSNYQFKVLNELTKIHKNISYEYIKN